MTFLIIYSIVVTVILVAVCYFWVLGKGRTTKQDIAKLEAENEALRVQHNQDIKKLQEAFGGDVEIDSIDDIINSQSGS